MSVSLEQAQTIAAASLAKARELALKPVSVVVLDPRATLVVVLSEDGVSTLRARIAQGKANAAIAMGMGTRALMARADEAGALLGAVGISGDTSDNDEAAAVYGIAAADLVSDTG